MSPDDQRRAALIRAQEVRSARAAFKRRMKDAGMVDGPLIAADLLIAPPSWADTWGIEEFLLSVPGVGRSRGKTILVRSYVSAGQTVGALPGSKRAALVKKLQARSAIAEWNQARTETRGQEVS